MTTLREAAQMALDALEHGLPIIEDFGGKEQLQLQHKAIAVLYEALRAALAAPPEELELPKVRLEEFLNLIEGKENFRDIPLMRTEWPTQEPLPKKSKGALSHEENKLHNKMILEKFYEENAHLYIAPPQREWQGLTDEERKEIIRRQKDFWGPVGWELECAKAIEAKLKEKNGL